MSESMKLGIEIDAPAYITGPNGLFGRTTRLGPVQPKKIKIGRYLVFEYQFDITGHRAYRTYDALEVHWLGIVKTTKMNCPGDVKNGDTLNVTYTVSHDRCSTWTVYDEADCCDDA